MYQQELNTALIAKGAAVGGHEEYASLTEFETLTEISGTSF